MGPDFRIATASDFKFGAVALEHVAVRIEPGHDINFFEQHNEYDFKRKSEKDYVPISPRDLQSAEIPVFMWDVKGGRYNLYQ